MLSPEVSVRLQFREEWVAGCSIVDGTGYTGTERMRVRFERRRGSNSCARFSTCALFHVGYCSYRSESGLPPIFALNCPHHLSMVHITSTTG